MVVDNELVRHMADPHNYGNLEEPDAVGIGENPENGEKVIIYLKVAEEGEAPRIETIRFQAIACMTTVVAGSIITHEAENVDFETAEELIAVTLGMLENYPPEQAACSEMVAVALKAAMDNYRLKKENPELPAVVYKIEQSCAPEPVPNPLENPKES
ncbi:iron-sulfur cluster assembly scaffold protein [Nitratifractor sp.]|uniref:iron-sulfur cluster assembly scaffold protein n=1 Tax=Nitratifractor sp. TaxID=2268144 RepID=UPI0025D00340|nr:iron-sulfur cluster assembly scaffold protein [Nitratifractor sp.]